MSWHLRWCGKATLTKIEEKKSPDYEITLHVKYLKSPELMAACAVDVVETNTSET